MNDTNKNYDVIVVGAGPAGITAALFAAKQNRSVLLLERTAFPREKICGDGLSTRAVKTLEALGLYETFLERCPINRIDGVVFSSPKGARLPINYASMGRKDDVEGYTLNRTLFDDFLLNEARRAGVDVVERFTARELLRDDSGAVVGVSGDDTYRTRVRTYGAKVVVCACGIFPRILRLAGMDYPKTERCVFGVKQYFKGVDCDPRMIEMHFIPSIIEGYFWIFPEVGDVVNIGFIIPERIRRRRHIDGRKELERIISSPRFAHRFRFAEPLSEPKAAFLNLGGTKVFPPVAGLLVIGDSMGLTEHFTGEGVGNAMFSAQKAAEVINSAFTAGDFSAKRMSLFHEICVKVLLKEFRVSAIVNRMKCVWLIDFVIGAASRNGETMMKIAKAVASQKDRKRLLNPLFYLRLLLRGNPRHAGKSTNNPIT